MEANVNALRLKLDGLTILRDARSGQAEHTDSVAAMTAEIEDIQAQLIEAEAEPVSPA